MNSVSSISLLVGACVTDAGLYMKPSLDKSKQSALFSIVPDYSLYEYHWDGPKRHHVPVWQPRQTTLFVVFDGESRRLFSTARILVYYSVKSLKEARQNLVWDVQQLGSVIHSFRGQVRNAPPNATALPKLTVAFEVEVMAVDPSDPTAAPNLSGILVLRSPASTAELRRSSIGVVLECEVSLTADTLSLALSFTHSTMLRTPIESSGDRERYSVPLHPASRIEYITTRVVRVLPPATFRRKIANECLPTELLIKMFEDDEFRDSWHVDLLSFAQVCRAWSCAMGILQSRLNFSEDDDDDDDRFSQGKHLLDVDALAKALSEKPILGYDFRHFTTNNVGMSEDWKDPFSVTLRKHPVRFTEALIAIVRATKYVERLHLGLVDPGQADALFAVLYELRDVHTFSIGGMEKKPMIRGIIRPHVIASPTRLLSVIQLARCMAKWPALRSLQVHHLHPGILGIWRFALRPPACALTQLVISRSQMGDKDLAHLFASSARSLERVVLDRIEGVSNAGLSAFLLAISPNVVYLTIQDVALPPFRHWGNLVIGRAERALDGAVHRMPRLRELRISGDVASEFMLDRRSKMFVARATGGSREVRVPVVRLWLEDVPRLCGFVADRKWPGWSTPDKALWR